MKLAARMEKDRKESYDKRKMAKNYEPVIKEITGKDNIDLTNLMSKLSQIEEVLQTKNSSTQTVRNVTETSKVTDTVGSGNAVAPAALATIAGSIDDLQAAQASTTSAVLESQNSMMQKFGNTLAATKDWIVDKTIGAIGALKDSFVAAKEWIGDKVSKMTAPIMEKVNFIVTPIKQIVSMVGRVLVGIANLAFRLVLSTAQIVFSIISFLVTGILFPIIGFLVTGVLFPIMGFLFTTVVTPLLGIIGTVLSAVIGGVATILTAIMPILLPVLAIAALIFLAVYLISSSFRGWVNDIVGKVWDWLKTNVWGWISSFATNIMTWLGNWWNNMLGGKSFLQWAWDGWVGISQAIGRAVVDGLVAIGDWIVHIWQWISTGASQLWNWLKDVPYLGPALQWIEDVFVAAWEGLVATVSWLWEAISPFVDWVMEKINQLIDWIFSLLPEEVQENYDHAKARGSSSIGAAAHAGAAYFGLAFSTSDYMRDTLGMENPPDAMSIKRLYTQELALEALIQNIMKFHDDPTYVVDQAIAQARRASEYGDGPAAFTEGGLRTMVQGMYDQIVSNGLDIDYYQEVVDPEWNRTSYMGSLFQLVFDPEDEDQDFNRFTMSWWRSTAVALREMKEITGNQDNIPYDFLTEAWGYDQIADAVTDVWRAEKGMIVRVAEAGDDEAIIPLNERGINFMAGTMAEALSKIDLPPVDLSDNEHKGMEEKFDEIKEAIAGMGKGLAASIANMRSSDPNRSADKTKQDEQLQINKILARGKLGGTGGKI
jgi:hypothetical protein